MSMDSAASTRDPLPAGIDCSLCGHRFSGTDDLLVQCYPEGDRSAPDAANGAGFLAICDDCAVEVDELADTWRDHDGPVVGPAHSIAMGYHRVSDDCSFCQRPLGEESLLGVEYYRHANDGAIDDYANYSICGSCADVFDEFLKQVGAGE